MEPLKIPGGTEPGLVLVMARSADVLTVVSNVAALLARLASKVVLVTLALLVSVPAGSLGLIAATSVMVRLAPAASVPIESVKDVPAPLPALADTNVSPLGSVSVSIVPWASDGP